MHNAVDIVGPRPIQIHANLFVEHSSETSLILRAKTNSLQVSNALLAKSLLDIKSELPDWLSDYVLAYDSLLLEYDPSLIQSYQLVNYLKALCADSCCDSAIPSNTISAKTHLIEVCYEFSQSNYPNDMELVAQHTGLSPKEIIQLHQSLVYQVFAIGFMPNFAYLGELPPALCVPRLTQPRLKVPPGAVAITDNQTAVYPNESPGGWHIIGYTHFSFMEESGGVIAPNDKVMFKALDIQTFTKVNQG